MSAIDVRILGPLEVVRDGAVVRLRGARQREIAALLAVHVNEVVRRDTLIDELWEEEPPETAPKVVQNAISQLRKALDGGAGEELIRTEAGGYVLRADPDTVDARRFERLAAEGRAALSAGKTARARDLLGEALGLWRGQALADLAEARFAQPEAARLEELRLTAFEDRIEADLSLSRHAELVGELEALSAQHPYRERLRAHLMLVLYRSGRQADALALYQETRRLLVTKLGIEPSPFLHQLERAILRHEPELDPPAAPEAEPARAATRPTRKTVAVLAAEVVAGEASPDPEALARAVEPALSEVERIVEAHGATVQRLPGSSLLALYGIPTVHEDDPLRAARAAVELRQAGGIRVGLAAGEVIVDPSGHVSGQPVVQALRLQQRAAPEEVLVGPGTERLLRSAGSLERVGPRDGSKDLAWRLVDLVPDASAIPRRLETPLVGRRRELEQLHHVFERAIHDRTVHLFTVLGPAGIGKSRLAAEFATSVAREATVLTGRCVPYGHGMTFRPLADMLDSQLADPEGLAVTLAGDLGAELFLRRVGGAIGLGDVPSTPTETFWAVRRLLEALARRRPLVVVIDDIHWAEELFLDLVEHIAEWARSAPILLLCLARPDLLDERPAWGGGKANATKLLLDPLSDTDADALIDELPGGAELETDLRGRLATAAEGNPLFLEQTLALLREEAPTGERLPVPPTIQALLAARLDRLPAGQRLLLENAAVVGREFELETLCGLLPEIAPDRLERDVAELVRKDLVRPENRGDLREGFRFQHSLIRAAAYDFVPKEERARLHEAVADRLEMSADRPEQVAYHPEQAHAYPGRRASARGDLAGATNLLARAAAADDEESPARLEILADLAEALRESGEFARAEEVAADVAAKSAAAGDRRLEAHAAIVRLRAELQTNPRVDTDAVGAEAARAVAVFESARDHARLAKTWELLAWAPWRRGQVAAAETALWRAVEYAQRAGDRRTEGQALNLLVGAALYGPMPVDEAVELCTGILARPDEQLRVRSAALRALGALRAMQGDFEEGRRLVLQQRAILEDLGLVLPAAATAETSGFVEMLAGDPAAAEQQVREGYESLSRLGETSNLPNIAAMLAHILVAQGRSADALALTELTEQASAHDDAASQVLWRTARARALAAMGRVADAEVLAREAVILAERTDFILLLADALVDLAEVLRTDGTDDRNQLRRALDLYERKGNAVSAARTRTLLEGPPSNRR